MIISALERTQIVIQFSKLSRLNPRYHFPNGLLPFAKLCSHFPGTSSKRVSSFPKFVYKYHIIGIFCRFYCTISLGITWHFLSMCNNVVHEIWYRGNKKTVLMYIASFMGACYNYDCCESKIIRALKFDEL